MGAVIAAIMPVLSELDAIDSQRHVEIERRS
jgi:hypothetical protein